nr:MAG TPA: hypothetical protein [Caudoviricetes sp.]
MFHAFVVFLKCEAGFSLSAESVQNVSGRGFSFP